VVLTRDESSMLAQLVEIPGVVRETNVCATLKGSLFLTMERAGESPELAMRMAQIFEFDIDFYRDPQPGDRFCLLVEKKVYDNGQPPTYRRILAAKYDNAGSKHDAFLFGEHRAYYSAGGRSLKSAFLRSPLEFDARVSSGFSYNRMHPILHTRGTHLGTDYAAPTGTPVRAVASGRVVFSALSGDSGNLITIEHTDGYRTQYLHLSRRVVEAGQHVAQGDRIGLVGMTGLATGPHLDMRISHNGKYMDWERMRSPRTVSLSAAQKQAFQAERDRLVAAMDHGPGGGVETAAVR
jgi:murein DD-endopeptidase MepM/ murein hydrolase activator NlpD